MPKTSAILCEACAKTIDLRSDRHYSKSFTVGRVAPERHVRYLCFPCAGALGQHREAFLASTLPRRGRAAAA